MAAAGQLGPDLVKNGELGELGGCYAINRTMHGQ